MQLPRYDITVIISDPDNPETRFKVTVPRIRRERITNTTISIVDVLETFELEAGHDKS